MLPVPRIVGLVTGLLGIVTAGVCIWLLADPVEFDLGIGIIQTSWDGGDSPKVGIAAAVLMIVVGISFHFINPEGRFNFFAGALVVILALSIASMSVAIKDEQDVTKARDIAPYDNLLKMYDKMRNRLTAVAAVGGIDSFAMLICIAALYKYRS